MRLRHYILTLLVTTFGCENKKTIDTASDADSISNNDVDMKATEVFQYNIYNSDSVTIDVKSNDYNFLILLTVGKQKVEYDLAKMNIPNKKPAEIKWANNEFACIMTWCSQAQSRHIFIPTKATNELIYIDKDIEEMDSVNNNIVYIDTVRHDIEKIVFKAENLLTRRSKSLEIEINEKNGIYPYFGKIILTINKLTIETANENKSIDITDINGDL